MIHQVSVFLENRPGQLSEITKIISDAGVDLRALNIAETADYGILRLIVNSTQKMLDALKDHGYVASVADVIAVAVPDHPGGLAELLQIISDKGLDIEYMYSIFSQKEGLAYLIFRVKQLEECLKLFEEHGVRQAAAEELGIH